MRPWKWVALSVLLGSSPLGNGPGWGGCALALAEPPALSTPAETGGAAGVSGGAAGVPAEAAPLRRVAVIGASISAGFNTSGMMGLPAANLADSFRKMFPKGCRVESYADTLLFEDPAERGPRQIAKARKLDPTLIVAVDFPFWWAYGFWFEEPDRLVTLNRGLDLLLKAREGLTGADGKAVPILISLLPDTTGLTGPTVPHPLQIPDKETLAKCNDRLRAWAAENEAVYIVPLREDFDHLRAKEKVKLGAGEIDPAAVAFMQPDGLHTTVEGLVFVACRCAETMQEAGIVPGGVLEYQDPVGLAARLRAEGAK